MSENHTFCHGNYFTNTSFLPIITKSGTTAIQSSFLQNWYNNNILVVSQLLSENGILEDYQKICERFSFVPAFSHKS